MLILRTPRTLLTLAVVLAMASDAAAEILLSPSTTAPAVTAARAKRVRRTKRFRLSRSALAELRAASKTVVKSFPIGSDGTVDLEVTRSQPFAPGAVVQVVGAGGKVREVPMPDNVYFAGKVVGDPNSRAIVIAGKSNVRGMIQVGGDVYPFGPANAEETETFALSDVDVAAYPPPRQFCQNDVENQATMEHAEAAKAMLETGFAMPAVAPLQSSILEVDLAIDTDAEFRAKFASDQAAADYIGSLVAAANAIYRRDVNIELRVVSVRLFSASPSSDPWTQGGGDLLEQLREVAMYWQGQGGLPNGADALQFVSGKPASGGPQGGIAYVSQVCNAQESASTTTPDTWAFGVAQVYGSFNLNNPNSIWDVMVFTHELGHVFGSPHTHCYSPYVDRCYGAEPSCYAGAPVWSRGTIMSYCHAVAAPAGKPSGLANVDLQFDYAPNGPVSQRIRSTMENAACIQPMAGCGDAIVQAGEQCDDGNTTNGDGCSATCQTEVIPEGCGDGQKSSTEECDDGNNTSGDGCSRICTLEPCVASVPAQTNWDVAKMRLIPGTAGTKIRASARLGIAVPFGTLDPRANGFRLLIEDAAGNRKTDIVVPGGAGWTPKTSKKGLVGWAYSDKAGTAGGVTSIKLTRQMLESGERVKLGVTADGSQFDTLSVSSLPLAVTTVLDVGVTGACGRYAFSTGGGTCGFNKKGTTVSCIKK